METMFQNLHQGELVPILLGYSSVAQEFSQRLFWQYGIVSHVFCHKNPLPFRFSLSLKVHPVRATENERLLLDALCDFANQPENRDRILWIIPCTPACIELVNRNRSALERLAVLINRDDLERMIGQDIARNGGTP